jgi:ATP-dependent Clp protease protease subunit
MDLKMHPKYKLENADGSRVDFNDISLESMGVHSLFGEVDGTTMKTAVDFVLKANMLFKDDLTLILNTVGGETSEGFALVDVMEASRLHIRTVGMGNVISMGMLLICAGTKGKRVMLKNTCAMAHQFSGYTDGKFHELISTHKSMLYLRQQFVTHFLRHTKMSEKQINDIMFGTTDRYLSPTECRKFGIVDHVVDELPALNLDLTPALPLPRPGAVRSKRQAPK